MSQKNENWVVYRHISPSGKSYIGISKKGMMRRWRDHIYETNRGDKGYFKTAIRKYGPDNFRHEALAYPTCKAGAVFLERLFISYYTENGPGVYNMTHGGDGGDTMSGRKRPEHSKRMKELIKDKTRGFFGYPYSKEDIQQRVEKTKETKAKRRAENPGIYKFNHTEESKRKMAEYRKGNPNYALPHTEETKRKISEALKGKIMPETQKKELSDYWKSQPDIKCPHCGKVGRPGPGMNRWHFDNCREKK